jgi:hypothetical protein
MKSVAMQRGVWGAVVALGGLLNGCAVLTVDVDVYKGALVNEEHVQLHQLVALASGAKPMLIHLRDELEWPDEKGNPPMEKTWHRFSYVPEPPNVTDYNFFQKHRARSVNAILSLYEDLSSPDLAPYGKRLSEVLERYRRSKLDFEPSEKRDQAIYDEIKAGFKPDESLSPDLRMLKRAYEELLVGTQQTDVPSRKVGKLMDVLTKIAEKENPNLSPGLEASLVGAWQGTETYRNEKENLYARRLPFRAVWKFLGEGRQDTFLLKATKQLCVEGDQGDRACRDLSARVKELADAYWNSRQAIHEIWEESLSLLMRIERLERGEPNRYQALREDVIALVVELTNVRHIASALDRLRGDGKCSVFGNVLERGLMCEGPRQDAKMEWTEANVKDNPERFETILRRALSAAPAGMAHFLLDLDSLESNTAPQASSQVSTLVKESNKGNSQRVVRLGLNRSYIDDDKQRDSQKLLQSVQEVNRNLSLGFERGRLLDGIHTLTENYLKSHDAATRDAEKEDERKLLDVLVEFAQKVLFLANHEGLASRPGTPGLISGGIEKLNRGLFGDYLTDGQLSPFRRVKELYGDGLSEEKNIQYIRVLQAVGNSILFSANELRERERHRVTGLSKVKAEVDAVNSSRSADPQKVLENLLSELKAEKAGLATKLTDAKAREASLTNDLALISAQIANLKVNGTSAQSDVTTAQNALRDYQTSNASLEALAQVLTDDLAKKIRQKWIPPTKVDAASVAAFLTGAGSLAERIQAELVRKGPSPTQTEINNFQGAATYLADPKTEQAFTATRSINANTFLKFIDLLDIFMVHLRQQEQNRGTGESALTEKVRLAERTLKDIQTSIAEKTSRESALKQDLQGVAALIGTLPNDETTIKNAIQAIDGLASEVRKEAQASSQFSTPSAVYLLLRTLLSQEEAKAAAAADKLKFKDAQTVLLKRMPPLAGPTLNPGDYKSPQAVMDEVIALLRHRQMEAVERFGKGSDQDKKATEALENAYQHRAGMIYLRPSSAYLRTSFPSTSLQDNPNLAWDNMLLQQGIRNLPFSSELRDILDPSVRQDRLLTSELDKQYWQNINRVRVSGTGFTNQVVVKDDVGNWYVKQYYGDTEDIIKSAKHLALYSLGAKLAIDLAGELKAAQRPKDDPESGAGAGSPPLNRMLEKYRTSYQTKTTDAATKLKELHIKDGNRALQDQIEKAWGTIKELKDDTLSMEALKAALSAAIREWDEAAEALKSKPDQDPGQAIVKDIRGLSRLEKTLSAKIQDIDKEVESNPRKKQSDLESELEKVKKSHIAAPHSLDLQAEASEAERKLEKEKARLKSLKTHAAAEVSRVVGPIVLDMLKDRKQALDSYEQAIMFIGDASNSKNSP